MVKKIKKGTTGIATKFITRRKAIRTLQLSLGEFRKLCILKGIHPRDPKNKNKKLKKAFYLKKDITFLKYEPLINHFRTVSATRKKLGGYKVRGKKETFEAAQDTLEKLPSLDKILKERYPEFKLALRDLDDALTTLHLFANVSSGKNHLNEFSKEAQKLVREFDWYVIKTRSLSKAFISIKGYYYQTYIEGQCVTWLVPHKFQTQISKRYPAIIYNSFVNFYQSLLSFVLYKLYHDAGLKYPPVLDKKKEDQAFGLNALLVEYDDSKTPKPRFIPPLRNKAVQKASAERIETLDMKKISELDEAEAKKEGKKEKEANPLIAVKEEPVEEDEEQKKLFEQHKNRIENQGRIFEGMKVFISREVPRHPVEFVLLSFGAKVSFEAERAPFPENDPGITHQIVDREFQRKKFLDRKYVQPQWVFDCANEKFLIPVKEYAPGHELPPHLSPFAPTFIDGYNPERREKLNELKRQFEEQGFIDESKLDEEKEVQYEVYNPNEGLTAEEIYEKELEAEKSGKNYSKSVEELEARPKQKKDPNPAKKKQIWESANPAVMLSGKKRWLYKKIFNQQKVRRKRVDQLWRKRKAIEAEKEARKEKKN